MNSLRLNKDSHPIFWIDNFLSNEEIKKIINYSQNVEWSESLVGNKIENKEKKPYALDFHIKDVQNGKIPRVRISNIKWIVLNSNTNWIYKKIIKSIHNVNQENFNFILKYLDDIQFTEYKEENNGFYAKHTDCGEKHSFDNYVDIRKLSISIQLTDENEYEGGELVFYLGKRKIIAPKTKGTIIFFESDIPHEVIPIKKGTRHSLVTWVCGPNLR